MAEAVSDVSIYTNAKLPQQSRERHREPPREARAALSLLAPPALPADMKVYQRVVFFFGLVLKVGLWRAIGYTAARWVLWFVVIYPKMRFACTALVRGRVGDEEFMERMAICLKCPSLATKGDYQYCGACGCPKWVGARLVNKNKRRGHNCPTGLHPGSIPYRAPGRKCKGCGENK